MRFERVKRKVETNRRNMRFLPGRNESAEHAFPENRKTSKPANQQTSKPANQQTSKPANQQTSKP